MTESSRVSSSSSTRFFSENVIGYWDHPPTKLQEAGSIVSHNGFEKIK